MPASGNSRPTLRQLVASEYPRRPACFDSDGLWREWILGALDAGDRVVRRVDVGKRSGERRTYWATLRTHEIDYCSDCTRRRQEQMQSAGRCQPSPAACAAADCG